MASEPDIRNTLDSLLESGEFSDLTVRTATRDFKVHKGVLCTASVWFRAACTKGFKEAEEGIITLPEDEGTVEAMLQYLYNTRVRLVEWSQKFDDSIIEGIRLLIAADKYQLHGLAKTLEPILNKAYQHTKEAFDYVVEIGTFIFGQEELIESPLRQMAAVRTAAELPFAALDDPARKLLLENQQYTGMVLEQFSKLRYSASDAVVQEFEGMYEEAQL